MRKFLVIAALCTTLAAPAFCDMLFLGSNGNLSASANFSLSGNTLAVTLTNTSSSDALVPSDLLMGVFFNTSHLLTPLSASLNGSTVYYGSVVHNVGEGWQYKSGISAQGKNSGISAAGFGVFGPNGNFYSQSVKLGGANYGILSAGDNSATGNKGVTKSGPLFKNSIVFTLQAGNGFDLSDLGETVVFQYGTSLTEPTILAFDPPPPQVPEPSGLMLLGSAMTGVVRVVRRKIKR